MKLDKQSRDDNVNYMVDGITHIIKTFDKRPPGSKGERDAQNYMASELKGTMDKVWTEDFDLHPGAFMGWIYITIACVFFAFATFWFNRVLSIVFVILALIPMITQLIMYKEAYDPLFKKETSLNVVSVKKPKGEVKRRIVLNGHADATWEWTLLHKLGFNGFRFALIGSVVGLFYIIGISIISLALDGLGFGVPSLVSRILGFIAIAFIPLWFSLIWFSDEKTVVDGANDNLTGCYVPIAVAKIFKEKGIDLENTELVVMLSGSEEAGLRGAKRFAAAHKEEYSDVETVVIPFETLREKDHISVFERDLNMTVAADRQLLGLIKKAGDNVGVDIKVGRVELGATDAAAFTQAGYKSACFAAMDHNLKPYYHTRLDTSENLCPETLGLSLDVAIETVLLYDREGLGEPLPKGAK